MMETMLKVKVQPLSADPDGILIQLDEMIPA
jgi:hypothetical protein